MPYTKESWDSVKKFLLTTPLAQITLFVIMKIKIYPIFTCTLFFILQNSAFAVDAAPHITDWEIVEKLTRLEEGQKKSEEGMQAVDKGLNKRIDDLRSEMNGRFEGVNKRIDDLHSEMNSRFEVVNKRIDDLHSEMNSRFEVVNKRIDDLHSEMDSRFDTIQWMLGLFITIALVIFGFILRLMWLMHRKQAQMETTLEMQKNDISFIKGLIEKLLPHKGAL
ncbi:MAG: hypothetical protein HW390_1066 [Candidatus Brocadiaceae bacterium]|nr:hypothetical protein [Candidatus Brocadiaceae bacterium]